MARYIFEDNTSDRELNRLRMIEGAVDAETIALLEQTGLTTGASCMEIGAGAGSIVEWMASRVGTSGLVMAVDKKTVYLQRFSTPPVRVIEGNLLEVTLDRPVDVAHARYVLIHNANDAELLRTIRAALKPGGMVVLEEPDFTSAALLQPTHNPEMDRVHAAVSKMFTDAGLDPGYGLRLPRQVVEAGFDIVHAESRLHLSPGGSPLARMMAESALVLRESYTKTGLATDGDIDHYVARAHEAWYWAVYYTTVSVVARAI